MTRALWKNTRWQQKAPPCLSLCPCFLIRVFEFLVSGVFVSSVPLVFNSLVRRNETIDALEFVFCFCFALFLSVLFLSFFFLSSESYVYF